jgi:hypothetical protein
MEMEQCLVRQALLDRAQAEAVEFIVVTTIQVVVEVQDPILKLTPLMAPGPVMEEMVLIRSSWARLISLAVVAVAQAIQEVLPATEDKVVAVAVAVGQGVLWVQEVQVH